MENENNEQVDENVTPLMVRDEIIDCFNKAHCLDTGLDVGEQEINEIYCRSIVEKAFSDTDSNFNKPTKEELLKVMDNLANFSKNFRDQEIINENYNKIMGLINKIK